MSASDTGIPGDQVRVTVSVAVAPADAFAVFTEQIDHWWRRGLRYRIIGGQRGILHLEPFVGGRLFESYDADGTTRVFESGKVTVWQPPSRLVFTWRAVNFSPSDSTEVEVTFVGTASGTLVTVTHRGWSKIAPKHPVRHDLEVAAFLRMMGMWWADLLEALRCHVLPE